MHVKKAPTNQNILLSNSPMGYVLDPLTINFDSRKSRKKYLELVLTSTIRKFSPAQPHAPYTVLSFLRTLSLTTAT